MTTANSRLNPAAKPGTSACRHTVLWAAALLLSTSVQADVNSGSTGADGAFNPLVNTEVQLPPSGVLNYTTVNIPAGVTVTFKRNVANTPVYLLASGDVTVAGTINLSGGNSAATGTYGDGVLGDDGTPGQGGPGGYDGGRGGRDDAQLRPEVIRGGTGLGPGGGPGGVEGADGCGTEAANGYYKYIGVGGAHATAAYSYYSVVYCGAANVKRFAQAYGSPLLQPLLGGSGGGGGLGGSTFPGSGGGGGGGALLLASSGTLLLSGTIDARGGDAGGVNGGGSGSYGAGGAGGAIRLVATTVTGNGALLADGGCINTRNLPRQFCGSAGTAAGPEGYGGAPGRIRIEAEAITFAGSTVSPAASMDQPGPIFIAGTPALRIASVAGRVVPANPTGVADITLPATTTGPISVTFETVNVPVGNTVVLRVAPAYGQPIEAISPAIVGSAAAGTAAVSVTLPSGPSTLQATTTYTVVVASADTGALSRFANNEVVEKVEVTVALQGEARARLTTVSGKQFEVPYLALQAAGFRG